MRIAVFNLGCKVNEYETAQIVGRLNEIGYDAFEGLDVADMYILNTCAVTNEAERKSRQAVTRVRKLNPEAKIIVCGCASQHNSRQFARLDNVVYITGTADKTELYKHISDTGISIAPLPRVHEACGIYQSGRTRAYIKITDGCDRFCSYCLIPYVRGRVRSRSIADIVNEAKALECRKEIVLTGIDISSFGKDTGESLKGLFSALSEIDARIRIGSLEVGCLDNELLGIMEKGNFCRHFHLSLQSGSDGVLKAMNRHYTTAEYCEAVGLIRKHFPDAAITTDIIVGFPTETDEQHKETLAFAEKVGFSDVHVFEYSLRDGTVAAKLEQVEGKIKKARVDKMLALRDSLKQNYFASQVGKEVDVLIEDEGGYSDNYIKVYVDGKQGEMVKVVLTVPYRDGMKGTTLR